MHADEIPIDEPLVRRLLASAFPEWANLSLARIEPDGTDNAIFRLSEDMVVRLPRIHWASEQPVKEHAWLPRLAPFLPLEIPTPLALGPPVGDYPCHWSICRWLEGEMATPDRLDRPARTAEDLAGLLTALRSIDPTDGPAPDGRGGPLAPRDDDVRRSIAALGDAVDAAAVTAAWESALAAPEWSGPPIWIHGDLDSRNLLARGGRLTGILDFGTLAVGDPSCDVMVAWKMVPRDLRRRFRADLGVDEATWERARGWVLSQALMAASYYTPETNPTLYHEAWRWLAEALDDR